MPLAASLYRMVCDRLRPVCGQHVSAGIYVLGSICVPVKYVSSIYSYLNTLHPPGFCDLSQSLASEPGPQSYNHPLPTAVPRLGYHVKEHFHTRYLIFTGESMSDSFVHYITCCSV